MCSYSRTLCYALGLVVIYIKHLHFILFGTLPFQIILDGHLPLGGILQYHIATLYLMYVNVCSCCIIIIVLLCALSRVFTNMDLCTL